MAAAFSRLTRFLLLAAFALTGRAADGRPFEQGINSRTKLLDYESG